MVSLHTLPFTYLKTSPRWQKKSLHSDSIPIRRQNKLWKMIMQDSSYRARNLKHPAMCTASSRVPGGARWMPISLLFCRSSSCQQTKLPQIQLVYGDWHLSLWDLGKHNTHLYDWRQNTFACLPLQTMNVAEVCTVQTPTLSWDEVWLKRCFTGDHQGFHVLQRQWQWSAPVTPMIASQPVVVGVPRRGKCKETPATVKYRHDESHKIPCYQDGLDCIIWKHSAGFYHIR